MKQFVLILCAAFLLTGVVVAGEAEAVTLEGTVLCAKCKLHEDLEDCQNVLVVEEGEKVQHFYLAKNEAAKAYGDVCMGTPMVRVTGTVSDKDGKSWLAASKIENLDSEG